MGWKYSQSSGVLTHDGKYVARGYSGKSYGKNNPYAQWSKNVGPIPCGWYRIEDPKAWHKMPMVMNLTPIGHSALGRDKFKIHGEKRGKKSGDASKGCLIFGAEIRCKISYSADDELQVTY